MLIYVHIFAYIKQMMASPFLYGCHYAWMLSVFTVVIVYGVACPLIMPIGLSHPMLCPIYSSLTVCSCAFLLNTFIRKKHT